MLNGLYKAELIHARPAWPSVTEVESATMNSVHWWNDQRLHEALGYATSAEVEPVGAGGSSRVLSDGFEDQGRRLVVPDDAGTAPWRCSTVQPVPTGPDLRSSSAADGWRPYLVGRTQVASGLRTRPVSRCW